jgi:hypothetical protein
MGNNNHHAWFLELQPRFYSLISKGAVGPMEGKKRATPSSKTGKKSDVSTNQNRNIAVSFLRFLYYKSVGIYILELMH